MVFKNYLEMFPEMIQTTPPDDWGYVFLEEMGDCPKCKLMFKRFKSYDEVLEEGVCPRCSAKISLKNIKKTFRKTFFEKITEPITTIADFFFGNILGIQVIIGVFICLHTWNNLTEHFQDKQFNEYLARFLGSVGYFLAMQIFWVHEQLQTLIKNSKKEVS